jgi:hypothetical protein
MKAVATFFVVLLVGCAHTDLSVNNGSSVRTSSAALQVNASGGVAVAIVAAGVAAATVSDLRDPQPMPRYQSFSDWLWGRPAPAMDPERTVAEQDCTKPIETSGNLRCR